MKYKKIWTQLEVDCHKLLFLWMLNHHCSGAWFYITGRLLPVHASVNTDHLQYFVKILFYILLLEGFAYHKTVQTGIHFSFKPFAHCFFFFSSAKLKPKPSQVLQVAPPSATDASFWVNSMSAANSCTQSAANVSNQDDPFTHSAVPKTTECCPLVWEAANILFLILG